MASTALFHSNRVSLPQLLTLVLAVVLFVKYIFFDKSETFPTSVPLTPIESQRGSKSLPAPVPGASPSSLSCSFRLADLPDSLMQRRGARPPSTVGSHGNPALDAERLRLLLQSGRNANGSIANGGVSNGHVPRERSCSKLALPAIDETGEANGIGVHSSVSTQACPVIQPRLGDTPAGEPRHYATIGVQTDQLEERVSPFVIGGSETPPSSPDELDRERIEREAVPSTPRPVEECLAIFKSEVRYSIIE